MQRRTRDISCEMLLRLSCEIRNPREGSKGDILPMRGKPLTVRQDTPLAPEGTALLPCSNVAIQCVQARRWPKPPVGTISRRERHKTVGPYVVTGTDTLRYRLRASSLSIITSTRLTHAETNAWLHRLPAVQSTPPRPPRRVSGLALLDLAAQLRVGCLP